MTRTPYGDFQDNYQRFMVFKEILELYQQINISGGNLHIYLEDGNSSIEDIKFCLNTALEQKDHLGAYLATELLHFGEQFIKNVIADDIWGAWFAYKQPEE